MSRPKILELSLMPSPCFEYCGLRVFSWPHSAYSYYSNAFLCEGRGRGLCGFAFFFCPSVCPSVQMRPLVMLHINDIRMTACSTAATGLATDAKTDTNANGGHNNTDSPLSGRKPIFLALPPLLFPPQDAAALTSVGRTLGSRLGERQPTSGFNRSEVSGVTLFNYSGFE